MFACCLKGNQQGRRQKSAMEKVELIRRALLSLKLLVKRSYRNTFVAGTFLVVLREHGINTREDRDSRSVLVGGGGGAYGRRSLTEMPWFTLQFNVF